jgi:hypothetical protein
MKIKRIWIVPMLALMLISIGVALPSNVTSMNLNIVNENGMAYLYCYATIVGNSSTYNVSTNFTRNNEPSAFLYITNASNNTNTVVGIVDNSELNNGDNWTCHTTACNEEGCTATADSSISSLSVLDDSSGTNYSLLILILIAVFVALIMGIAKKMFENY